MNYQKYLEINNNKISLINILIVGVLCISAVRNQHENYTFPFSITLLICVLLGIFFCGKLNKKCLLLNAPFLFMLAVCLFLQFVSNQFYFDAWMAIQSMIMYYMVIILCSCIVSSKANYFFWKIINFFSLLGAATIIIQYIGYKIGVRLDMFPVLKDFLFNAWEFSYSFRPCGIFSEPSHFAEFALISLYGYLFINFSISKIVIITSALALSTSMLGILAAPILFLGYMILSKAKLYQKMKMVIGISILALLIIFIYISFSTEYLWIYNRIVSGGTSGARIFRSIEIFNTFNLGEMIYGIGLQNQSLYLNFLGIVLESDSWDTLINREFAQTLGYILCTTGILGFCAFIYQYVYIYIKANNNVKMFTILFLIICFTSCILSRPIFIIYLIVLYNMYIEEGYKE